jgi:DNA-binding response OmpR family regulator
MLSMPSPTIDPVIPNAPILVVDDDAKIVRLVRTYLERDGFTVVTAADGPAALDAIETHEPALVVLDLMLPELDGRAVIRAVRKDEEAAHTPILVLSARSSTIDRIAGLEDGADDYLPKPFSPAELVLRVKSILRRASASGQLGAGAGDTQASDGETHGTRAGSGGPQGAGAGGARASSAVAAGQKEIRHADLTVDPARHEVRRDDGTIIDLTRVEFSLLTAILGADGRVLSRDQLLDAVYGADAADVLDRTIDVHIRRLRDKLDDDPDAPRYVQTVRGVGYRAART